MSSLTTASRIRLLPASPPVNSTRIAISPGARDQRHVGDELGGFLLLGVAEACCLTRQGIARERCAQRVDQGLRREP